MAHPNGTIQKEILVVEDDTDIRDALARLLELEGYHVYQAGNGQEALSFLKQNALPGLIVLDLMMPVMDGFQFRAQQQGDRRIADIPVAVLTADVGSRGRIAASAYLTKPIDIDLFLQTVARFCRATA